MNNIVTVVGAEAKKAAKTKVPLITLIAVLFIPLVGALFMIILKNPEGAENLGLISTKAELFAGTADWPTYLNLFSQSIAIGGVIIFSFIAAWVFGQEYIDKTITDLMVLPVSRAVIVTAKLILITLWSFLYSLLALSIGIIVGFIINLPEFSTQLLWDGILNYMFISLLAIILAWAIAFIANISKSYFPAIGFAIFMIILAQIIAVLGWGEYFPWTVPALYSQIGRPAEIGLTSYLIVLVTGLLGVFGTILWWQHADHAY
jgi:ABC-2 type transport system permease protein